MNTKVLKCVSTCWWFIVHSGLYPPLFPFLPLPPHSLRQQRSSSNGQAEGYWDLWGINQLTGCHGGGGWGSWHWCTGFLIKTSCTNCHVFERVIKLLLWSLEANFALPAGSHMSVCVQTNTHTRNCMWKMNHENNAAFPSARWNSRCTMQTFI